MIPISRRVPVAPRHGTLIQSWVAWRWAVLLRCSLYLQYFHCKWNTGPALFAMPKMPGINEPALCFEARSEPYQQSTQAINEVPPKARLCGCRSAVGVACHYAKLCDKGSSISTVYTLLRNKQRLNMAKLCVETMLDFVATDS